MIYDVRDPTFCYLPVKSIAANVLLSGLSKEKAREKEYLRKPPMSDTRKTITVSVNLSLQSLD